MGWAMTKDTDMKNTIDFSLISGPCRLGAIGAALALLPVVAGAGSPAWLRAHDAEIKALVAGMTLEEKVGQMTQPEVGSLREPDDIGKFFLGSLLSGGNSDPKTGNGLADWSAMYEECQKRALKTRLGIPLIYGIDAVHGHNNVLGAVVFPHQIGLGCTGNAELVREVAAVTAREMRATGVQWSFAPCLAVPRDIRWGRTYEGYSDDPAMVTTLGAAAVRGLQGESPGGKESVAACAKHFAGDGGTAFGTAKAGGFLDQGDTRVDEATMRAVHLAGYPAAIAAGVMTIMPSYSSWNGVKCSASKYLLTDVLKKEFGFDGFLISDYNAIDQIVPPSGPINGLEGNNAAGQVVTPDYKKCIEISFNAGMDMVMVTDRYREFITFMIELVKEGKVPMERIDDAVTRILRVKFAMGMMAKDAPLMADAGLQAAFGSAAHRAVARRAVRESLVVLKNDSKTLPLAKKAARIHLAGRAADDLGMQCGGWTIDWQGKRGQVTTGGTTVLAAVRAAVGPETKVSHAADGTGAAGADVAVVVIGEEPYAEMHGDRESLAISKEDMDAVKAVKASGVPVVVVVFSGRPLILGELENQADAIVAAWLPGTEGSGITDVLFGDVPPTGKLSFAWPRSVGQPDAEPLFPRGFGLGY